MHDFETQVLLRDPCCRARRVACTTFVGAWGCIPGTCRADIPFTDGCVQRAQPRASNRTKSSIIVILFAPKYGQNPRTWLSQYEDPHFEALYQFECCCDPYRPLCRPMLISEHTYLILYAERVIVPMWRARTSQIMRTVDANADAEAVSQKHTSRLIYVVAPRAHDISAVNLADMVSRSYRQTPKGYCWILVG